MSETSLETPVPQRSRKNGDEVRPAEGYTREALEELAEEQERRDSMEEELTLLLLALLAGVPPATIGRGASGAASGVAIAGETVMTTPGALYNFLEASLLPYSIDLGMIMRRRARRLLMPPGWDWRLTMRPIIQDSVERIRKTVLQEAARRDNDPRKQDIYSREITGFHGLEVWAERAARTIMTTMSEAIKRHLAERFEFQYKRWLTRLDDRVRPSHQLLEGKTIAGDERFTTSSGAKLWFPGDPSAPLNEIINCRCVLLWMPMSQAARSAA